MLPTLAVVINIVEGYGLTISDGLLGDVDPNSFLDAGHELVGHSEIPAKGEIDVVYRIEAIWD